MTVKEVVLSRVGHTAYENRARYHTSENPFRFGYPPVPARQFLAERDRAFDPATPADPIAWGTGDVFCFPGGSETTHRAAGADCLLFVATDEPLLAFGRLSPPAAKDSVVETAHWPAAEIEHHLEGVWQRTITADTTGCSVMFSTKALAPGYMTIPSINVAINTLAAGKDQRPHRHNGVAVTLALQGEGVHSMIDDLRVDWSTGAAQITPATKLHSHHNRGTQRMRSLVIQDEGLHYYTRTRGFSFD